MRFREDLPSLWDPMTTQVTASDWVSILYKYPSLFKILFPYKSLQSIETSFLCFAAAAAAKSLQSCLTLCDPRDSSPLGFSVSGILQARILEWVSISFSKALK